ncbi:hypothetical protein B0H11DRAFT_1939203 [Mycena galericulata]|nr:hypothetical protein B0H11DRAFT_1939203 [Mycena galericulata]
MYYPDSSYTPVVLCPTVSHNGVFAQTPSPVRTHTAASSYCPLMPGASFDRLAAIKYHPPRNGVEPLIARPHRKAQGQLAKRPSRAVPAREPCKGALLLSTAQQRCPRFCRCPTGASLHAPIASLTRRRAPPPRAVLRSLSPRQTEHIWREGALSNSALLATAADLKAELTPGPTALVSLQQWRQLRTAIGVRCSTQSASSPARVSFKFPLVSTLHPRRPGCAAPHSFVQCAYPWIWRLWPHNSVMTATPRRRVHGPRAPAHHPQAQARPARYWRLGLRCDGRRISCLRRGDIETRIYGGSSRICMQRHCDGDRNWDETSRLSYISNAAGLLRP